MGIIADEHEDNMYNSEQDKRRDSDDIGCDCGGEEGDKSICNGRPDMLIGDAVVATAVLEELEVLLAWIKAKVHYGLTYLIMMDFVVEFI